MRHSNTDFSLFSFFCVCLCVVVVVVVKRIEAEKKRSRRSSSFSRSFFESLRLLCNCYTYFFLIIRKDWLIALRALTPMANWEREREKDSEREKTTHFKSLSLSLSGRFNVLSLRNLLVQYLKTGGGTRDNKRTRPSRRPCGQVRALTPSVNSDRSVASC